MKTKQFGNTDLRVSEIGLGCARIGGIFQNDAAGFVNLLSAARDAGITFFDTADMYSQGESEALIGRAFRRRRHEIVIASKVGYRLPAQRKLIARLKPFVRPLIRRLRLRRESLPAAVRGSLAQDFDPRYLRRAVEASLRRLRSDYIDVLQLHSPPTEVVRRGEWVDTLERLKKSGKIRYYGVACDGSEAALAALNYEGVSSLQIVVNLLEQDVARAVLPSARERQVAVIARECLANGLLVKSPEEIDLVKYGGSAERQAHLAEALETHRRAAADRGTTLANQAMSYARQLEGVSVALIGVRSVGQLDSLLRQISRT